MIQHHKNSSYHPQENGTVKAFNKILERGLLDIFLANQDDWVEWVPAMLWAYRTIVNFLHKYMPFQLLYVREVEVHIDFTIPNLFIAQATHMMEEDSIRKRLEEL